MESVKVISSKDVFVCQSEAEYQNQAYTLGGENYLMRIALEKIAKTYVIKNRQKYPSNGAKIAIKCLKLLDNTPESI